MMRPTLRPTLHLAVLVAALGLLAGCHSLFGSDDDPQGKVQGKRIAVLSTLHKPEADTGLQGFEMQLPGASLNTDWPQVSGDAAHSPGHVAFDGKLEKVWKTDVGAGSGGDFLLLARPIVAVGKVFTMDAEGSVSAFDAATGDRLWRLDTTPEDREKAMGAGLAFDAGALYATTGLGEVLSLAPKDGKILWRKMLGTPIRGAPTVAGGRVFVVTINNETQALSAKNGDFLWKHSGISETATLMGASSPAVSDDNVVVAYSSGEIFDLRAQNGRVAWTDVLAAPAQVGALPAIADIRGQPVIDHGGVFAVSHSGRAAAIDVRAGERAWEAELGGTNTPYVSGNIVFLLTSDSQLIALVRKSGRIAWIRDLPKRKDPEDRDSKPVFWWGPVLAGAKLWLTNSQGHVASFALEDGHPLDDKEVGHAFFIPPIVANNVMFLLDDHGDLIALR